MSVIAVVGANWGDEGKGKIIDSLSVNADIVVRFQGGNNAGHTIKNSYGKFALHLLPSGVCNPHVVNVIGPGVALNIPAFLRERNELIRQKVPEPKILISDRAQIILPYHMLFDEFEEERLGKNSFGSTKSGIAPFYSDKYLKIGIQVSDLFDRKRLKERLDQALPIKNVLLAHLYHKKIIDCDECLKNLIAQGKGIKPFVADTTNFLHDQLKQGKTVMVEGQLGALRDPDHGIYPFSTSSSTLAGFATVGAGIPPYEISRVIAVTKAYSSCVGAGPFVSEIFGDDAHELRERGGDGGEYGATTGRPRRMGWFDVVATKYGCMVQGANEVVLSLLDVLGYLRKIPVCVAYTIDGKKTTNFPVFSKLIKAKPIIKNLKGWNCDISDIRSFDKLPIEAQAYVLYVEKSIGVKVTMISVGPRREQLIFR